VALGLPFVPVACLCDQAIAAARVGSADAPGHCHGAPPHRAPHGTSDHAPDCAHCHATFGPGTAAQVAGPSACQSTVLPSDLATVIAEAAAAHPRAARRTESPPGHALLRSKCVLQL
jgi:hypothetical protein